MEIHFDHPGAMTTIQDTGRSGLRHVGIPQGGAADRLALSVANLLVGNDEGDAALECTLAGPTLRFSGEAVVAVCGATSKHAPNWRASRIPAGGVLRVATLHDCVYAYIAIAGGIDVPRVMGSRSTDTRMVWGGLEGRRLRAGDRLKIGQPRSKLRMFNGQVNFRPWYPGGDAIRIVRGAEWDEFDPAWTDSEFRVSPKLDRMGVRLSGPKLDRRISTEMQSAPVFPGTIQVPPDGQPIVLLADAQTLGGYPRIAHVISADLHRIAQSRPGSAVRFAEVSLDEAHDLWRQRMVELAKLRAAIEYSR